MDVSIKTLVVLNTLQLLNLGENTVNYLISAGNKLCVYTLILTKDLSGKRTINALTLASD